MLKCPKRFLSLSIDQLKKKLKRKGLPVSGKKEELCQRLLNPPTIKQKSSLPKLLKKTYTNSEFKFYISLLCNNPNSAMAKAWVNKYGITNDKIKQYCKQLPKKQKYLK